VLGFGSSGEVTRNIFTQVLATSSFRLTHAIHMCIKKKSLKEMIVEAEDLYKVLVPEHVLLH